MKEFFYGVLGGFIAVLFVALLWFGYDRNKDESPNLSESSTTISVEIPTLEEAVNNWSMEKHNVELYNLCMELPEQIVRTIFNRIGTNANYLEVAEEYLRNTNYYISMQIKEIIPAIPGPDAKNVENVEIKTKVNRTTNSDNAVKVPVIVTDSVK